MGNRATKKSKNVSYLDIDLEKLFGKKTPDSTKFRQAVGQEILDVIVKRTKKQMFLSPAKKTYSKDYVSSVEFTAFGKSKNQVNLTQSGDMLQLMDIIKEKGTKIRIGWDDSLENKKATNINFGISKGMPQREFLGLTNKEEEKIREKFKRDLPSPDLRSASSVSALKKFLLGEATVQVANKETKIFSSLVNDLNDEDLING